jgi:hypothetical protein
MLYVEIWAGIAQSVQRLATGWTVRGSNPGGGDVFRTRPDRPWGPSGLLYNGHQVFPGGKAAGAWPWPPTTSNAKVKEKVQLHLYSPSGPSGPVLGLTLPLSLSGNHVWMYFFKCQYGTLSLKMVAKPRFSDIITPPKLQDSTFSFVNVAVDGRGSLLCYRGTILHDAAHPVSNYRRKLPWLMERFQLDFTTLRYI